MIKIMRRCSVLLLVSTATIWSFQSASYAANTNPINWGIVSTYYDRSGQDVPLRYGQRDQGNVDGFGLYHIEEHNEGTPTVYDMDETLQFGNCVYQKSNDTTQCTYETHDAGPTLVIYTERVDSRSKDGRPVGIITAYYQDYPPGAARLH